MLPSRYKKTINKIESCRWIIYGTSRKTRSILAVICTWWDKFTDFERCNSFLSWILWIVPVTVSKILPVHNPQYLHSNGVGTFNPLFKFPFIRHSIKSSLFVYGVPTCRFIYESCHFIIYDIRVQYVFSHLNTFTKIILFHV
jgi:hypothetical protein